MSYLVFPACGFRPPTCFPHLFLMGGPPVFAAYGLGGALLSSGRRG